MSAIEETSNDGSPYGSMDEVWTYYKVTVTGHDHVKRRVNKKIVCKSCSKVWNNLQRCRAKRHTEKCIGSGAMPVETRISTTPASGNSGNTQPKRNHQRKKPAPKQTRGAGDDAIGQYSTATYHQSTFNNNNNNSIVNAPGEGCNLEYAAAAAQRQDHHQIEFLSSHLHTPGVPAASASEVHDLRIELRRVRDSISKMPQRSDLDTINRQINELRELVGNHTLLRELMNELTEERKKNSSMQQEIERLRKLTGTVTCRNEQSAGC